MRNISELCQKTNFNSTQQRITLTIKQLTPATGDRLPCSLELTEPHFSKDQILKSLESLHHNTGAGLDSVPLVRPIYFKFTLSKGTHCLCIRKWCVQYEVLKIQSYIMTNEIMFIKMMNDLSLALSGTIEKYSTKFSR